jgi:SAM-dependent methyltransferase
MTFKDLFSPLALRYSKFRPYYPDQLFDYLASLAPSHEMAWDCATGNGQAAVGLARHFQRVVATDPSIEQVSLATRHERIFYIIATAEHSCIENNSADLITVAQALHWFDLERFYAEAKRVLRPKGVLAAWSYGWAHVSSPVDEIVKYLHDDVLGSYWLDENKVVDEGYLRMAFPFEEEDSPHLTMRACWNLDEMIGYLMTWSAAERYRMANKIDPVELVKEGLGQAWGDGQG